MQFIRHRINTVAELATVDPAHGVELDLRDKGERLILQHDPFSDGEDFCEFLRHYYHGTMILNIKSERIEHRVLEEIRKAGTVRDYFFLDSSFPMIRLLVKEGEHRIAVRFSEYEPIEGVLALAGQVDWVWVDCFTRLPLDRDVAERLARHFKICIVSPELQKHTYDHIEEFATVLKGLPISAICTKNPVRWGMKINSSIKSLQEPN